MEKPSETIRRILSAWENEQFRVWRTEGANTINEKMQLRYITTMSKPINAENLRRLTKFAVGTLKTPYAALD